MNNVAIDPASNVAKKGTMKHWVDILALGHFNLLKRVEAKPARKRDQTLPNIRTTE